MGRGTEKGVLFISSTLNILYVFLNEFLFSSFIFFLRHSKAGHARNRSTQQDEKDDWTPYVLVFHR